MRLNTSITEVARNFAEYINRVAFRGERFVLVRGRRPVAELVPVASRGRLCDLRSLLESLPSLGDDAATFGGEVEDARDTLTRHGPDDPWAS